MAGQELPLQEPLASEVTTALIEFGRLSQHAGSAAFDALSTLADELLKRLVALCKAQRGAVLLIGNLPDTVLRDSQTPTMLDSTAPGQQLPHSNAQPVRTLALHALREEEVYALLTAFPAASPTSSASAWRCANASSNYTMAASGPRVRLARGANFMCYFQWPMQKCNDGCYQRMDATLCPQRKQQFSLLKTTRNCCG